MKKLPFLRISIRELLLIFVIAGIAAYCYSNHQTMAAQLELYKVNARSHETRIKAMEGECPDEYLLFFLCDPSPSIVSSAEKQLSHRFPHVVVDKISQGSTMQERLAAMTAWYQAINQKE